MYFDWIRKRFDWMSIGLLLLGLLSSSVICLILGVVLGIVSRSESKIGFAGMILNALVLFWKMIGAFLIMGWYLLMAMILVISKLMFG